MRKCKYCGVEVQDDEIYCHACGHKLDDVVYSDNSSYNDTNNNNFYNQQQTTLKRFTHREVALVVLLSILTCGIYSFYWFYVTTNELNENDKSTPELMNYAIAFLLALVTCGIYGIYWNYMFYKKVDAATNEDNFLLNFLLSLFVTGIVPMAIVQNSLNNKSQ
ncbi:MAG: DUF4234 domain-containing protein [Erysipelotrichaceae bacterium]|nr:DUF4234 domain-containing protein [Erysipelotrichaceae bacterium]